MPISNAAIQDALHRAAYHLQIAAGDDVFISQEDVRQKLATLPEHEQILVNAMYQFLRAQERNPRGRVTLSDLARHLPLIEQQILPIFETDPVLNSAEYQALQRLGVPHVSLANALKYTASIGPDQTPDELARRLARLGYGVGLYRYANSGHTVFAKVAVPYADEFLTGKALLSALSQTSEFKDWGGNVTIRREDPAGPYFDQEFVARQSPEKRTGASEIVRLMYAYLEDLKVIQYGRNERYQYPTFIVGIMRQEPQHVVGIWSGAL